MSQVGDFLRSRLRGAPPPYLFVGAGLSRRYADTPDWRGLLRHFAAYTSRSLESYVDQAGGSLPQAASLLASEFQKVWEVDARFAPSRSDRAASSELHVSPLKYEVAKYFREVTSNLVLDGLCLREFELLSKANIDAVVTTNYDALLNIAYPNYRTFRSQDELLFADPQGIGEIYMIHGSAASPGSLVLTTEDYDDFRNRNAYLAAKLLTFFAERPILFVGYSLTDANVQEVLSSLVRVLRGENVARLRDRLYFVAWKPGADSEVRPLKVEVDGSMVDAFELRVPDFVEVFEVLGSSQRALPAHVLRHLKEQVFDLVSTSDPNGRLVQIADIEDAGQDLDVVFGVGARVATRGVLGLTRWDLVDDLLGEPHLAVPPLEIVHGLFEAEFGSTWYVPYWKYLHAAGLLERDGRVRDQSQLPAKLVKYIDRDCPRFQAFTHGDTPFSVIETELGPEDVLRDPWRCAARTSDVEGIAMFLRAYREMRIDSRYSTGYAKLATYLDWLKYGPRGPQVGVE